MKLLAAVLALLCLTGCGQKDLPVPEPDPVPEQSLHAPGHPLEQQTSGIIEVFPTERAGTCQLYTMGSSLLLLDDTGISVFTGKGLRLSGSLSGGVPVYSDADSLAENCAFWTGSWKKPVPLPCRRMPWEPPAFPRRAGKFTS